MCFSIYWWKTKLLKSRGRVGYNMKLQRNIEFLQEHSEYYQIALPSNGSFVESYLLDIHQKFNSASERFISIVRQERFLWILLFVLVNLRFQVVLDVSKGEGLEPNYKFLLGTWSPTEYLVELTLTIIVRNFVSCLIWKGPYQSLTTYLSKRIRKKKESRGK